MPEKKDKPVVPLPVQEQVLQPSLTKTAEPPTTNTTAPAVYDNTLDVLIDRLLGADDPATGPTLRVTEDSPVEITVAELKKAAQSNPKHPDAITFLRSVRYHMDTQTVYVSKWNLLAVLQNKYVELYTTHRTGEDGLPEEVTSKRLVDKPPVPRLEKEPPPRPPEGIPEAVKLGLSSGV